MNTAELLARRRPEWQELEMLLIELGQFRRKPLDPEKIARFTTLYRCVCSDLALAESQQLPADVILYLNNMVGKAHHELYRSTKEKRFQFRKTVFEDIPRWIVTDKVFWFAFLLFWLPFIFCATAARLDPLFPERTVGRGSLEQIQKMYSRDMSEKSSPIHRFGMFGFYVSNNGGIGLKCFALGILGGVIGAYVLLSNSIILGTIYGFMSSSAVDENVSRNFTTFVTAHSAFELTAIILSAAAGMRLGFAFFSTNGFRRFDSVRLAARRATPIAFFAFVLFCLAALLEGFVSPSPYIPYFVKMEIAVLSAGLLFFYIVICGLLALRKKSAVNNDVLDNSSFANSSFTSSNSADSNIINSNIDDSNIVKSNSDSPKSAPDETSCARSNLNRSEVNLNRSDLVNRNGDDRKISISRLDETPPDSSVMTTSESPMKNRQQASAHEYFSGGTLRNISYFIEQPDSLTKDPEFPLREDRS